MFEKEAKERAKDYTDNAKRQVAYECGFLDGVDFVYSKANEWHYVKDGDLPKDEDWKCCVSRSGYPYVAKYEELFVSWTNQENKEVMCPYAWKEIILPKEDEIERLKAGKPRWHKVADEGLPSDSSGQTYVVIDAYNCCALASFDNGTWHNYRNIENVVAWCEIPKFSE